jgi:RsiW-degrading membrane proteinase PrsW (M82 family)
MEDFSNKPKKWHHVLSLVLSILGIIFFLGQASFLGEAWRISIANSLPDGISSNPIGLLVWASILAALFLLPLLIISIAQLRGKDIPHWLDTSQPVYQKFTPWVILIWPIIVALGWFISSRPALASPLLGLINILVAGIPVLWIYTLAQRKLFSGPQIRKWRIFGFSLTVMPVVVLFAELLALILFAIFVGIWFSARLTLDPQLQQGMINFFNQIIAQGDDVEAILQLIEPYLLKPGVLLMVFGVIAGIMPIIEETLKPIAIWSLARRKISPQEGFVVGLLCGAGFALMENVLYFTVMVTPQDWLFMAISRSVTGVLHMLGSGLVGWGLARAWVDRKFKFLGLITIAAFFLHGLWNAFALYASLAPLLITQNTLTLEQTLLYNLPNILLFILSSLALFFINRYFQRKNTAEQNALTNPLVEQRSDPGE